MKQRRLFTAPLFTYAKEKGSEASAKHAGVEWGGGVGFAVSRSPPPTNSSLPFCAGVQLSRDSISPFNDRIKIRANRGL